MSDQGISWTLQLQMEHAYVGRWMRSTVLWRPRLPIPVSEGVGSQRHGGNPEEDILSTLLTQCWRVPWPSTEWAWCILLYFSIFLFSEYPYVRICLFLSGKNKITVVLNCVHWSFVHTTKDFSCIGNTYLPCKCDFWTLSISSFFTVYIFFVNDWVSYLSFFLTFPSLIHVSEAMIRTVQNN